MVNLLNFLGKPARTERPKHAVGARQRAMLQILLENRDGLTADELSIKLNVTRAAIHQHLVALQRDDLVERRDFVKTKGRPGHVFAITDEGVHQFPKRYDWFSELLLGVLSERLSDEEMIDELARLGQSVGLKLSADFDTADRRKRIEAVAEAMNALGYVARISRNGNAIEAFNCVYHHLATANPQVCEFDMALLETAVGSRPTHTACMVRGGSSCCFAFSDG